MRFKGLDLNLLVALDVLLTEKNVSKAADRLCLSQSATSGALSRLREYFEDDLLIQVGRKMVVTPRALQLAEKVRASLMQIDGTIIQPQAFDPSTVERTIRICASDYVVITKLSRVIGNILNKAPNLSVVIEPPSEDPGGPLSRGELDLLAMPEVFISDDHPSEPFFEDEYVVVTWNDNTSIGDTITRAEFFKAHHVAMKFASHTLSYEAWFMKHRGVERNIVATVGSFSAIPFLLVGTQNIALLQGNLARLYCEFLPLRILACPINIPPLKEHIQWHKYSEGDKCLEWVREEIFKSENI